MKQLAYIILIMLISVSCSSSVSNGPEKPVTSPQLSLDFITMKVGETAFVTIDNLPQQASLRDPLTVTVSGGDDLTATSFSNPNLKIVALKSGSAKLKININGKWTLNLQVVITDDNTENPIFSEATPRFVGMGINRKLDLPGTLTCRTLQPEEFSVRDLSTDSHISLNSATLTIDNYSYPVDSYVVYTDKSDYVNFIRITLKDNREAWLILLKEQS